MHYRPTKCSEGSSATASSLLRVVSSYQSAAVVGFLVSRPRSGRPTGASPRFSRRRSRCRIIRSARCHRDRFDLPTDKGFGLVRALLPASPFGSHCFEIIDVLVTLAAQGWMRCHLDCDTMGCLKGSHTDKMGTYNKHRVSLN